MIWIKAFVGIIPIIHCKNSLIRVKLCTNSALKLFHPTPENCRNQTTTFQGPKAKGPMSSSIEIQSKYFCDDSMRLNQKWVKSSQYFS